MAQSRRDKTVSHSHGDPKLIKQANARNTLGVGKFVYLDVDGIYKLAISNGAEIQANVQGYVWSFVGDDAFYLKTELGPLQYRFPLPKNFPIPGLLGDELYLSATSAGDMQTTAPSGNGFIVGYKTDYGMIYRPDPLFCCVPVSGAFFGSQVEISASTISASDLTNPYISLYELSHYTFNCSASSWNVYDTREIPMYEPIPCNLLNVQLCGLIDVTGSPKWVSCISGSPYVNSISGDMAIYGYHYSSKVASCSGNYGTYISPIVLYGTLDDLIGCKNGVAGFACPVTGNSIINFVMNCSACCSGVSGISGSSSSSSSFSSSSSLSSSSSKSSSSTSSILSSSLSSLSSNSTISSSSGISNSSGSSTSSSISGNSSSSSSSSSSLTMSCYYVFTNTYDPCNSNAWQGSILLGGANTCEVAGSGYDWQANDITHPCKLYKKVEVPNTNCGIDTDCSTPPAAPANPGVGLTPPPGCNCSSSSSSSSSSSKSSSSSVSVISSSSSNSITPSSSSSSAVSVTSSSSSSTSTTFCPVQAGNSYTHAADSSFNTTAFRFVGLTAAASCCYRVDITMNYSPPPGAIGGTGHVTLSGPVMHPLGCGDATTTTSLTFTGSYIGTTSQTFVMYVCDPAVLSFTGDSFFSTGTNGSYTVFWSVSLEDPLGC